MKLLIRVTLDAGGEIRISGDGLTAEDVNELFSLLSGYTVESTTITEAQDEPLPEATPLEQAFREGFDEGRPPTAANVAVDEQTDET